MKRLVLRFEIVNDCLKRTGNYRIHGRSIWENLDLSQYGPNTMRSVLTTSVKLLLCRTSFLVNKSYYYMALSHKDWELPNSRI